MNQSEMNRRAHSAVASILRVNAEMEDGDLWLDAEEEDWSEADRARFRRGVERIADYHERRGE